MPGPQTIIPGVRKLVSVQTCTVPANKTAKMASKWDWQQEGWALELRYGIITEGTLSQLSCQLSSLQTCISGDDFASLSSFVFESAPEHEDINLIGIFTFAGKFGWEPLLKDLSGADQDVTIEWYARPWPLKLVRDLGIVIPDGVK